LLKLAPVNWANTLGRPEIQEQLAAYISRRVTLLDTDRAGPTRAVA